MTGVRGGDGEMTGADITSSLVARLVATQFPQWADLPVRPVVDGGWDNRTFRLGDTRSVRLPSAAAYAAQVAKEQRWLPRLAPHLPLPIPEPLAMGAPAEGYPWHWSIYRWLDGRPAHAGRIDDRSRFATTLAGFLAALQRVDATGGPRPGRHNFYRGGPLQVYDGETRDAIETLRGQRWLDVRAVAIVWDAALEATWHGPPVWLHGDVAASNLLVRGGRLCAVIDFGCMAVGDPACDLAIAWTLLSGASREAFRAALPLDHAAWARGRGWALWKALITLANRPGAGGPTAERARCTIDAVLADRARGGVHSD